MINFDDMGEYRENNRLEVKKALGGLPNDIWETYSAFANTLGGYILLGVAERKDGTLYPLGLSDPEKLVKEFWDNVNNTQKVSVNILSDKNVSIEHLHDSRIIAIHVPRAERACKPVYLNGNPFNAYRRNGEGDYKCTQEECRTMIRDASVKTQDMLVLTEMDFSVFNSESIRAYRQRMRISRPNHVWEKLDDEDFLWKMGAAGIGDDGRKHPTAAGLLMFGSEYEIIREYPQYFLDYREEYDDVHRWTDRIVSSSGDWSGNIFDFIFAYTINFS